jgi:hypothetical protein
MSREELLPQELLVQIPALYSTEETPLNDKIIKVKFFIGNFTWLAVEAETREDGDVMFFGYVINHSDSQFSEWGYFTLNELLKVKLFGVLGVERDLYLDECTFGEYMKDMR